MIHHISLSSTRRRAVATDGGRLPSPTCWLTDIREHQAGQGSAMGYRLPAGPAESHHTELHFKNSVFMKNGLISGWDLKIIRLYPIYGCAEFSKQAF